MNANVGKYEPNVVKEAITGKQIKCKVLGIDKFLLSLGIGDDKVFHIVDAFFDIDPEGYWWELNVIPVNDNSPVLDTSMMMESVVTNLDLIDNFYEQVTKQ